MTSAVTLEMEISYDDRVAAYNIKNVQFSTKNHEIEMHLTFMKKKATNIKCPSRGQNAILNRQRL
jgi:uncharacterized protein YeeX (DUF496 family)